MVDDVIAGLRPGDPVRVTFSCGVVLTSTVRPVEGRLVLDIAGEHFVVREPDGRPAADIRKVEVVIDDSPGSVR